MHRSPRAATTALALLTAGSLVVGLQSAADAGAGTTAPPSSHTPSASPTTAASHRVTLITGDVVTVTDTGGGKSAVTVKRAPGSTGMVHTETVGKDLYVLPDEVFPYLAADRLDSRLFNVTRLIAHGYDDASTDAVPLIVEYGGGINPSTAPTPAGAHEGVVLTSIDGASLAAQKSQAATFWAAVTPTHAAKRATFTGGIAKIFLDGKVQADLAEDVAQVHAPEAWDAGYDGNGTKVAVLDTGIDADHPDLAGQVTASTSFVPGEDVLDHNGHGTHVASTIAGTGAASEGLEKGVAPGAKLVIGKVLGNDGVGQESWIIDGMEWAANHAPVVSMSLGSNEPSNGMDDPMDLAVNSLSEQTGALFVIAAGNQGAPGWINSPGAADDALTVGGVDSRDQLAWFSSMGPRIGDSALKPDIVAPGDNILAARSQYSEGSGYYTTKSGTSMATPHVAGAAAILLDRHPSWDRQQLKDSLMSSADGISDPSPYDVGTGRLDVARAALGTIHASGSRFFGLLEWPNANIDPITRTITYTNTGAKKATLKLSATMRDQNGQEAPAGVFAVPARVVVPAHGTRVVKVTAAPNQVDPGTRYAGVVVATLGRQPVARTSLAMDKESERYTLTLTATDRHGQPASMYATVRTAEDGFTEPVLVDGQTTLRLDAGRYNVMGWQEVSDAADSQGLALVGSPEVDLTQDREVDLDASKAAPVTSSIAGKRTATSFMSMEYTLTSGGGYDEAVIMPAVIDTMYAQPTGQSVDGFEFNARWRLRSTWMRVTAGKQDLDTLQANGSPWLNGSSTQDAVYVGTGTEAGYDGVDASGKVAVMSWDGSADLYTAAQVAQRHHAVFLLVVNNLDGERQWYASGPNGEDSPIPVATVSGLQGTELVSKLTGGTVSVTTQGTMDTPWTYDLVEVHQGSIPADLSYRPTSSELAQIPTAYYGRKPHLGGEFRFHFRPGVQYGLGFLQYMNFPATRTEWVSTQPGNQWYQGVTTIDGQWDLRGDRVAYDAGKQPTESWMKPVVYPRLGTGYWGPVRQYDFIQLNLPSFGDAGPGHTGGMDTQLTDQRISVYQGDTLLKSSEGWQSIGVELSPDKLMYRATSDVSRSARDWATSTRIHSEYEFWSEHNDGMTNSLLPLVQVGFDVKTDMRDDAKAGATDTIGFTAWQLPDVVDGGEVAGGKLSVSYDGGKTWIPLTLSGETGNWEATVTYPKNPSKWVSLKASAWDTEGNTSTQTISRAFGLR